MNIGKLQKSAHRMINGAGGAGFLIRAGVKRLITTARIEFKPTERGLYADGSERFFVSALGLITPPDENLDILEFKGKGLTTRRYRIIQPPAGPRPNGIVVYYDCICMYSETVA